MIRGSMENGSGTFAGIVTLDRFATLDGCSTFLDGCSTFLDGRSTFLDRCSTPLDEFVPLIERSTLPNERPIDISTSAPGESWR